MSTPGITIDYEAMFADAERHMGRSLTEQEKHHIRTIGGDEGGNFTPQGLGTNYGTGFMFYFYQAIAAIAEALGIGVSGGFDSRDMRASAGTALAASDERTQLWAVTQAAHSSYNRLYPLVGEQLASLVSGNVIHGGAAMETSLYNQGVAAINASPEVRALGPRLNRDAQGPQPPVERTNQYRYADADTTEVDVPAAGSGKSSTYALTA